MFLMIFAGILFTTVLLHLYSLLNQLHSNLMKGYSPFLYKRQAKQSVWLCGLYVLCILLF